MNKLQILMGLNEQQRQAAKEYYGPSFITAGPGSGKTKLIVSRTAMMIKSGIEPSEIILFTFTNKAAKEIKSRIENFIGEEAKSITVGTYHSVCLRILKRHGNRLGFSNNFSIYDMEDSTEVMKEVVKDSNIEYKALNSYISDKKNKMITPKQAIEKALNSFEEQMAEFYKQYQNTLHKRDAMDFDDLIYNTIKLLKLNSDILEKINKRYKYITADEAHDSAPRDLELIELLGGESKNICMIFDEDQSIYAFRGSDVEALFEFRKKINPKVFLLEQNYRCSNNILKASKELIDYNNHDVEKNIFTSNDNGMEPLYFEENNQEDESLRVLKLIMLLNSKLKIEYKDIAILFRMNYMSRTIEDRLLQANIPYSIVGGCPFYARKEIKDIMSYIRIINNPKDYEAFKRVINLPRRGIGESSLEKIKEIADNYNNNFIEASKNIELKGKAKNGIKEFVELIDKISNEDDPIALVEKILLETDYRNIIANTEKNTSIIEDKNQNLNELINIASKFTNLDEFIDALSLSYAQDEEEDNKIQMMSMHSSKGLEFKAVIIIGVNEGINPHWRAETKKDIQEERRLLYVAMTRAMEYLFITRPKLVTSRGNQIGSTQSRFIKEIGNTLIDYNNREAE